MARVHNGAKVPEDMARMRGSGTGTSWSTDHAQRSITAVGLSSLRDFVGLGLSTPGLTPGANVCRRCAADQVQTRQNL